MRRKAAKPEPQASFTGGPASCASLVLDDSLDLTSAVALAKSLNALRGADLVIVASGVRRIGTQCVQILASAAASWRVDGLKLSIVEASDEFLEALRLLGLRSALPVEGTC